VIRRGEDGISLVEALVTIAILGTVIVTFLGALSTGALATGQSNEEAIGQGLVRSQLENTKSAVFVPGAVTYPAVSAPAGWAISVAVSTTPDSNANIQKVTVTVTRGARTVASVVDYKVNRS
jgi:Tfp pilus assembly protein PilV